LVCKAILAGAKRAGRHPGGRGSLPASGSRVSVPLPRIGGQTDSILRSRRSTGLAGPVEARRSGRAVERLRLRFSRPVGLARVSARREMALSASRPRLRNPARGHFGCVPAQLASTTLVGHPGCRKRMQWPTVFDGTEAVGAAGEAEGATVARPKLIDAARAMMMLGVLVASAKTAESSESPPCHEGPFLVPSGRLRQPAARPREPAGAAAPQRGPPTGSGSV
jgi:hypothetical protein